MANEVTIKLNESIVHLLKFFKSFSKTLKASTDNVFNEL